MSHFLDLVFLKLALCLWEMTGRRGLTGPGRTASSVIKKQLNPKRKAIVQAWFELQYIFNYQPFFPVILKFYESRSSKYLLPFATTERMKCDRLFSLCSVMVFSDTTGQCNLNFSFII